VHTAEQQQQQQQGKERVCGHPARTCTANRIRHAHMQAQTPRDTIVVSLSAMLNASAPCVVLFLLLLRRSAARALSLPLSLTLFFVRFILSPLARTRTEHPHEGRTARKAETTTVAAADRQAFYVCVRAVL